VRKSIHPIKDFDYAPTHALVQWIQDNLTVTEREEWMALNDEHTESYLNEMAMRKSLPPPPL
jgi:hypothetical protein